MRQLLFVLVILACPLIMMLMMRGSHGDHGDHMSGSSKDHAQTRDDDMRIAELEQQVSGLKARREDREDFPPGDRS